MNCCDDAGRCTNGHNCASRNPPPLRFAPGAIERHVRPRLPGNPAQRRELRRWLRLLAIACASCVAVGLLSGYITARVLGA